MERKIGLYAKPIVEGVSFIICILGIIVSIRMNLVGRSLWFDEAALAWSFSQRSFSDLTATGLDLVQAAPAGWLYLLKIFVMVFGNTDFVLRVPSILSYVFVLVLVFYISNSILKMRFPMASAAFVASIPLMLQYSNVFKPYIFDCVIALLLVVIYDKYIKETWSPVCVGLLFGIFLWFSNPACFIVGGMILASGCYDLFQKNYGHIKNEIIVCIPVGVSFISYYFYWLRKVDNGMNGFWQDYKFPLIPTSISDLYKMKDLLGQLFAPLEQMKWIFFIGCILVFFIVLWKKEVLLAGIYGSFFVSLFASYIGMYPINKRMWLFIYPLIVILIFYLLDILLQNLKDFEIGCFFIGLFILCLIGMNSGIRYYAHSENVYWPGYEVKGEYEYLKTILNPEDRVYVFSGARPMFAYYNHYNFETIDGMDNPIMVADLPFLDYEVAKDDLEFILADDCYLVMSDTWDDEDATKILFDEMDKYGEYEMIYFEHETPLFHFTRTK